MQFIMLCFICTYLRFIFRFVFCLTFAITFCLRWSRLELYKQINFSGKVTSSCNSYTNFYLSRYFSSTSRPQLLWTIDSKGRSYILHVSRETLSCGGDGTLHFPQEVLFCLWTAHVLLYHKVSKTPAGSEDITQNKVKRAKTFLVATCQ